MVVAATFFAAATSALVVAQVIVASTAEWSDGNTIPSLSVGPPSGANTPVGVPTAHFRFVARKT